VCAPPAARLGDGGDGLTVEVPPARFEEMVSDALDSLPPALAGMMRNVVVVVEDGSDPHLLGLYEGIPLTERMSDYSAVLPDRITIYRLAVCAACDTEADVVDEVRATVVHEVGHHFGIDDDRLHELGW
jgi:predicted Zn-dependent protease with MMP-like domain